MHTRVSTGIATLDSFLEGGLETDCITALFGPPGSGKTNFCTLVTSHLLDARHKVCYVDTEHSFSMERLLQIDKDADVKQLLFLRPKDLREQTKMITSLAQTVPSSVQLIVIDTLTMLYRLEYDERDQKARGQELARQLKALQSIQKERKIPIIIVSQTYQSFRKKDAEIMLGGEMLRYVAKTIIECKLFTQHYSFKIKKHRSIRFNKEFRYGIVDRGIEGAAEEIKEEKKR